MLGLSLSTYNQTTALANNPPMAKEGDQIMVQEELSHNNPGSNFMFFPQHFGAQSKTAGDNENNTYVRVNLGSDFKSKRTKTETQIKMVPHQSESNYPTKGSCLR